LLDLLHRINHHSATTSLWSMRADRVKDASSSCRAPVRMPLDRPDTQGVPSTKFMPRAGIIRRYARLFERKPIGKF
jgi:hypothetical protein